MSEIPLDPEPAKPDIRSIRSGFDFRGFGARTAVQILLGAAVTLGAYSCGLIGKQDHQEEKTSADPQKKESENGDK